MNKRIEAIISRMSLVSKKHGTQETVARRVFFASFLLRFPIVEDSTIPTFVTDGTKVLYNEDFCNSLTGEELEGVLCHEAWHILALDCFHLAEGKDHRLWNQAGDLSANYHLIRSGLVLPNGALSAPAELIPHVDEYGTQGVYVWLQNQKNPNGKGKPGKGKPGNGQPGDIGDPLDEIRPTPGDAAARNKAKEDAEIAAHQSAVTASKIAGTLPGSLARFLETVGEAQVNWKTELAKFLTCISRDDYSWRKFSRRYISRDIYLPSLRTESLGHLAFAIDVSGSVGEDDLAALAGEILAVNQIAREGFTLIWCDAAVQGEPWVTDSATSVGDLLEEFAGFPGGGGTSYIPPFEWIAEYGTAPVCFIYLTDGYCDEFLEVAPEYPVLWVVTAKGNPGFTPPFGKVIQLT